MSLPTGQHEDRHRSWRLTATVLAGVLAVIVAAACGIGGGGDDDDDDDDDDDSMRVVRVVGAGSGGFVAAPDRAATSVPTAATTGHLIHRG
jgi:hypothetical protein